MSIQKHRILTSKVLRYSIKILEFNWCRIVEKMMTVELISYLDVIFGIHKSYCWFPEIWIMTALQWDEKWMKWDYGARQNAVLQTIAQYVNAIRQTKTQYVIKHCKNIYKFFVKLWLQIQLAWVSFWVNHISTKSINKYSNI